MRYRNVSVRINILSAIITNSLYADVKNHKYTHPICGCCEQPTNDFVNLDFAVRLLTSGEMF